MSGKHPSKMFFQVKTESGTTYYICKHFEMDLAGITLECVESLSWGTNGRFFHSSGDMLRDGVNGPLRGECGNQVITTSNVKSVKRISEKAFDQATEDL